MASLADDLEAGDATRASRSVLVVDDEPNMVYVVTRLLALEGVTAIGAANGVEGLAALSRYSVGLILCDVRMPVMDGPTMLRRLLAGGGPVPPVIFLTAFAGDSEAELLVLGASAVRSKPIDLPVLLALVRSHLGARAAATP